MSLTSQVEKWVDEVAELTEPAKVAWADGSKAEYDGLVEQMLRDGTLLPLNSGDVSRAATCTAATRRDVARTEQLTFICTARQGRRGPDQQLDGAGRGARRSVARALRRGDARAHDVRHPVSDGPGGLGDEPRRRHGHRQRLRRREHAHHDAGGAGGARSTCGATTTSSRGAALPRRPLARPPLHPALPRGAADLERRLGLRRQRAARQEVPRPAHRHRRRRARRAGSPSTC